MAEWTVRRWSRFGRVRLYAETPGGTPLGYLDVVTGQYHADDQSDLPLLMYAVAQHLAADTANDAPDPARVRRQVPATTAPVPPSPATTASVPPAPAAPAPVPPAPATPWVDLSANRPGATVGARAAQDRPAPRGVLARLLRALRPKSSWEKGVIGEIAVAEQLARLGSRWRVLHSVPVGTQGSDIDHIVIGPGGVFTVNAKYHPKKAVWVGGDVMMVNGFRVPYVRNSRHEARRAGRLLARKVGFPVKVRGIIAVMGAQRGLTIRQQPADGAVTVVARKRIVQHLLSAPECLTDREIAAVYDAARRSTTWT